MSEWNTTTADAIAADVERFIQDSNIKGWDIYPVMQGSKLIGMEATHVSSSKEGSPALPPELGDAIDSAFKKHGLSSAEYFKVRSETGRGSPLPR